MIQFTKYLQFENIFKTVSNGLQGGPVNSEPSIMDAFGTFKTTRFSSSSGSHKFSYWVYTLVPGETYVFSFYAKKGTMANMKYSVYHRGPGPQRELIPPTSYFNQLNDDWTRISLTVTLPSDCSAAEFALERDSGFAGTCFFCFWQLNTKVLKPYI